MATTPRVGLGSGKDNTDRLILNDYQSPAYAASIAIATNVGAGNTLVQVGQLTGALSLSINTSITNASDPFVGDTIKFIFSCDGTSRTVTFSTGFAPAGSLAVNISKKAYAEFIFDGTAWVEVGRSIGA